MGIDERETWHAPPGLRSALRGSACQVYPIGVQSARFYHIDYATKNRRPWIASSIQPELYAVLGNLLRDQGGVPFAINGMPDHVHLLASLPASRGLSDVLRTIKARSSSWLSISVSDFVWQTGYGAFTVSKSCEETVREYIENQKRHHATRSYIDEFRTLLKAHDFDPAEAEAHLE